MKQEPPPRGLLEEASPTKAARGQPTEQVPAECTDSYPGAVTKRIRKGLAPRRRVGRPELSVLSDSERGGDAPRIGAA